jgi:S-adenosylhomocysteine hydrolase
MSTTIANAKTKQDYKIADISLADFGRREILAEKEMPGLMDPAKTRRRNRSQVCASLIIAHRADRRLRLRRLSIRAPVRWAAATSSTQDHAVQLSQKEVSLSRVERRTPEEYCGALMRDLNKRVKVLNRSPMMAEPRCSFIKVARVRGRQRLGLNETGRTRRKKPVICRS